MKKNIFKVLLVALISACMMFGTSTSVSAQTQTKANLSFLAVSDIHLDEPLFQTRKTNLTQFKMVLNEAKKRGIKTFIGGGDYSSYGNETYWKTTKSLVTNAGFTNTLWAIGNHEYGITGLKTNANKKFKSMSGTTSPYYVKEMNGYTFIVLGAESGLLNKQGKMSSACLNWFRNTLKSVANSNKPVFIISHYDLDSGTMRQNIVNETKKYSNTKIFFLWGHMHDGEYANMTFDQCIKTEGNLTIARMGCVHYYNNDNADGLIVNVYNDRVELTMKRVTGKSFGSNDTKTVYLSN